jgi:hypothetical protein
MTIPYITPKQQEIPKLIYKFRFLNRLQIQKHLDHKDKRRVNSWLKDLCEKEYLEKIPKDNTFEQRTKLTIYRIGINGIRFLGIQDDCSSEIVKKLYKDKNRSDSFIDQCILLTDIYLALKSKTIDASGSVYEVAMYSDFENENSLFHFLIDLNPSLIYKEIKKRKKITKISYFLVEAFEATLPGYSINKRIRTYLEFYYSNEWEDNMSKPFPAVKFICPTKACLIKAKRYTKTLFDDDKPDDLSINFALADDVRMNGVTGAIWE